MTLESTTKNKMKKDLEKVYEESYALLNEEQKRAVDMIDGPVVVVAGPGTGKTQILTLRIANILRQIGADMAENILALTFTNSGVYAMRERLAEFVGLESAYRVSIFTFHSFAEEQIKANPDIFTDFAFSRPATDIEKIKIVEEILQKLKLEYLKTFASDFHYTRKIISAIDELKMDAISPEDFLEKINEQEKEILSNENSYYKRNTANAKKGDLKPDALKPILQNRELAKVYEEYQKALKKNKLYDFSDMVLSVVQEAEKNKDYLSLLQEKYQYILLDEHQDTNDAQNKMVELIASAEVNENRPNVFTVGDEKQAIYRFQGASVENFQKFSDLYDGVEIIRLKQNYRSSQNILDTAHSLIADKERLNAGNSKVAKHAHKLAVCEFPDYKSELLFIAEEIKKKIDNGADPNEIAVFYKENKNLGEIKSILEKYKISYKISSKENILDDKEIKKLILIFKAVENPLNDEILAKVFFIDFLNFDLFDVLKILERLNVCGKFDLKNKSIFKIIQNEKILDSLEISDKEKFLDFAKFLKEQKRLSEELDFLEFFEKLIHSSGFLKHLLSLPDNAQALRRLEKIFDEAKKEFFSKKNYSLSNFIEYVNILDKYDIAIDLGRSALIDGVNLMTAHGSKGLEFEYVYITNFVDSLWGGKRRMGGFKLPTSKIKGDIEDERRLFYVALTRAKKEIMITQSTLDMDGKEKKPSRLLAEIDEEFVQKTDCTVKNTEEKLKKYFTQREQSVLSVFDTEYVKKLFLQNTLSVTALNNYFTSPLKYFFRNLLRIPSIQTKSLLFGNAIHATLERFFNDCAKEKKVLPKRKLLEIFDEVIRGQNILEKYFDEIKERGKKVLEKYYENYKNDFCLELEAEKKAFAEIVLSGGEKLKLYGVMDKIEKMENGKLRVVDYKTGKSWSEKDKAQRADLERQLIFYKFLLDEYFGENIVEECVLDFVEKSRKSGEFEKYIKKVTNEDVEKLRGEIQDFAEDILSGAFLERKYQKNKDNEEYLDFFDILKNKKTEY